VAAAGAADVDDRAGAAVVVHRVDPLAHDPGDGPAAVPEREPQEGRAVARRAHLAGAQHQHQLALLTVDEISQAHRPRERRAATGRHPPARAP
jgi:hypothetical protein